MKWLIELLTQPRNSMDKNQPPRKSQNQKALMNALIAEKIYAPGCVEIHFTGNGGGGVQPKRPPTESLIAQLGGYSIYTWDDCKKIIKEKSHTRVAAFSRSLADLMCSILSANIYCILTEELGGRMPVKGIMLRYRDWASACRQLANCTSTSVRALRLDTTNGFSYAAGVLTLQKENDYRVTHLMYRPWAFDVWSTTAGQIHEAELLLAMHKRDSGEWCPAVSTTFQVDNRHKRLLLICLLADYWKSKGELRDNKKCAQTIGDLLNDYNIKPGDVSAHLTEAGCRPLSPSLADRLFRELVAASQSLPMISKGEQRHVLKKQTFIMLLAMVEPDLFTETLLQQALEEKQLS